jgi:hypothetical protein
VFKRHPVGYGFGNISGQEDIVSELIHDELLFISQSESGNRLGVLALAQNRLS